MPGGASLHAEDRAQDGRDGDAACWASPWLGRCQAQALLLLLAEQGRVLGSWPRAQAKEAPVLAATAESCRGKPKRGQRGLLSPESTSVSSRARGQPPGSPALGTAPQWLFPDSWLSAFLLQPGMLSSWDRGRRDRGRRALGGSCHCLGSCWPKFTASPQSWAAMITQPGLGTPAPNVLPSHCPPSPRPWGLQQAWEPITGEISPPSPSQSHLAAPVSFGLGQLRERLASRIRLLWLGFG